MKKALEHNHGLSTLKDQFRNRIVNNKHDIFDDAMDVQFFFQNAPLSMFEICKRFHWIMHFHLLENKKHFTT